MELRDIEIKAMYDTMYFITKMGDEEFIRWLCTNDRGEVCTSPDEKEVLNLVNKMENEGGFEHYIKLSYLELAKK